VALTAVASCLIFAQCSWLSSTPAPSPEPSSSTPSQRQQRTITEANLITAADLPPPIGGGKLIEYDRNARSVDRLSICQPEPMSALGASEVKSRSFRARYSSSADRPFARSTLDREPDTYSVALQFPDPAAAQLAKAIYQSWVSTCAAGRELPKGVHSLQPGFEWLPATADAAAGEVSEVVYQRDDTADPNAFFESVGVTVLEDRMMITVHIFYTDESPYSVDTSEDEAGFAHPQLGLVEAAAKRLSK
jgi:hypothetical protein